MPEEDPARQAKGVHHLEVDEDSVGQRLDNYLMRELKGVPKTRLYRAMRKGEIRVNKGRIKPDYRLVSGDLVRIPPLHRPSPTEPAPVPRYWAQQITERIIYEDDRLLVINKPSGLAVHGGSGLSFGLIESLRQLRPDDRYLELVHRLDRDTSGVIMIARRPAILRELHRQLREDKVDKRYLALVAGSWPNSLRVVDAPLAKNMLQSGERMVRVAKEGKRSITEFRIQERLPGVTLIEAKPITGRTHQIRVHARHAGFPLLGDDKYSDERTAEVCQSLGLQRLFLHARTLRISLPETGALKLEAPLDPDLEVILNKLRK
jgi:23S rRNA pseudouridine955/2504/2580 synthase